ncbi:MAG: zinc ribbon domain-containing protein [Opitutales bacterium]
MFCKKCGTNINDNLSVCPKCGADTSDYIDRKKEELEPKGFLSVIDVIANYIGRISLVVMLFGFLESRGYIDVGFDVVAWVFWQSSFCISLAVYNFLRKKWGWGIAFVILFFSNLIRCGVI